MKAAEFLEVLELLKWDSNLIRHPISKTVMKFCEDCFIS